MSLESKDCYSGVICFYCSVCGFLALITKGTQSPPVITTENLIPITTTYKHYLFKTHVVKVENQIRNLLECQKCKAIIGFQYPHQNEDTLYLFQDAIINDSKNAVIFA